MSACCSIRITGTRTRLDIAEIEALTCGTNHSCTYQRRAECTRCKKPATMGSVYPGEGVIHLGGFLKALEAIGYKGSVTQEILSAEAPAGTPEDLLARSRAGFAAKFTLRPAWLKQPQAGASRSDWRLPVRAGLFLRAGAWTAPSARSTFTRGYATISLSNRW